MIVLEDIKDILLNNSNSLYSTVKKEVEENDVFNINGYYLYELLSILLLKSKNYDWITDDMQDTLMDVLDALVGYCSRSYVIGTGEYNRR